MELGICSPEFYENRFFLCHDTLNIHFNEFSNFLVFGEAPINQQEMHRMQFVFRIM